ncbi:hypothetical protein ACCS91_33740 [Rhizobium ruizarguesonis]
MTHTYRSPNGHEIIGTAEIILATAPISGINADGTPIYTSWASTEVDWDTQETVKRDGKILFVDEEGDEWTFDQLVPEEDSDASG